MWVKHRLTSSIRLPAVDTHGPCQYACPAVNTPILLSIPCLSIRLPHHQYACPAINTPVPCRYAHPAVIAVICGAGDEVAGCIGS